MLFLTTLWCFTFFNIILSETTKLHTTTPLICLQFYGCLIPNKCSYTLYLTCPGYFVLESKTPCFVLTSFRNKQFQLLFSSPKDNVFKVGFCDGPLSSIDRASVRVSTISLNIFTSEIALWMLTKLHRNIHRLVSYLICSKRSSWLHTGQN